MAPTCDGDRDPGLSHHSCVAWCNGVDDALVDRPDLVPLLQIQHIANITSFTSNHTDAAGVIWLRNQRKKSNQVNRCSCGRTMHMPANLTTQQACCTCCSRPACSHQSSVAGVAAMQAPIQGFHYFVTLLPILLPAGIAVIRTWYVTFLLAPWLMMNSRSASTCRPRLMIPCKKTQGTGTDMNMVCEDEND
jgi:hypothetical protein